MGQFFSGLKDLQELNKRCSAVSCTLSAGLHGPLHMAMVCAFYPCSCSHPSARSAYTHTVTMPAAAWTEGWRGACTQMYSSYSLRMIDLSLSPTLDMSHMNCMA